MQNFSIPQVKIIFNLLLNIRLLFNFYLWNTCLVTGSSPPPKKKNFWKVFAKLVFFKKQFFNLPVVFLLKIAHKISNCLFSAYSGDRGEASPFLLCSVHSVHTNMCCIFRPAFWCKLKKNIFLPDFVANLLLIPFFSFLPNMQQTCLANNVSAQPWNQGTLPLPLPHLPPHIINLFHWSKNRL